MSATEALKHNEKVRKEMEERELRLYVRNQIDQVAASNIEGIIDAADWAAEKLGKENWDDVICNAIIDLQRQLGFLDRPKD